MLFDAVAVTARGFSIVCITGGKASRGSIESRRTAGQIIKGIVTKRLPVPPGRSSHFVLLQPRREIVLVSLRVVRIDRIRRLLYRTIVVVRVSLVLECP